MKYNFLLLLIIFIGGCYSTETTRLLHAELNREVNFLHERHIETIDAYSQSLKEFDTEINKIQMDVKAAERKHISVLAEYTQSARKAWVESVVSQFDQRVYEEITSTFDQTIDDVFWPDIVDKQKEYRDKADALKAQLNSHQCNKQNSGCSDIGFDNYRKLAEQYRQYSIISEYIIHLAYKEETVIWQRLTELIHQYRGQLKAKAEQTATYSMLLTAKAPLFTYDFKSTSERLNTDVQELKHEHDVIDRHWEVTKQTLVLLQAEINKPEVWELILDGAGEWLRDELVKYSSLLGTTVGTVAGEPIGNMVTSVFSELGTNLVDSVFGSLKSNANKVVESSKRRVYRETMTFDNANKTSI